MKITGVRCQVCILALMGFWTYDVRATAGAPSSPSSAAPTPTRVFGVLGPHAAGQIPVEAGFPIRPESVAKSRGAILRMRHGGTGAFVSPRGLVVTTHKVASACMPPPNTDDASSAASATVFLALSPGNEIPCDDFVVEQSEWLADVSSEVQLLVTQSGNGNTPSAIESAMRLVQTRCEQNSTTLCSVQGDTSNQRFDLFRTRTHRDVRLVFLPEASMVTFGGQDAQFGFPKYSFDVAFLRVYEGGQPLMTPTFLPFSIQETILGAPSILLGHPDLNERGISDVQKVFLKEIVYPFLSTSIRQQIQILRVYIRPEAGQRDDALRELAALEYWRKAVDAAWEGLTRAQTGTGAPLSADTSSPLDAERPRPSEVQPGDVPVLDPAYDLADLYRQHAVITRRFGPTWSVLAMRAREWIRFEDAEARMAAGGRVLASDRELVQRSKQNLAESVPIDTELETKKLAWGLRMLRAQLGAEHVAMQRVLDGRSPEDCAAFLIQNTQVNEEKTMRNWLASPRRFAPALSDPLVKAMRLLEDIAQNLATRYAHERARLEGGEVPQNHSGSPIEAGSASHALPRWSTGIFRGISDAKRMTPWRSQLGGVYLRHHRAAGRFPYTLSPLWEKAIPRLNFTMPYNLLSTHDADLAESGAPLVDSAGNIVAIMIDVNEPQIGNRFIDHGEPGRIISLHAATILHVLREVYGANMLLHEISAN